MPKYKEELKKCQEKIVKQRGEINRLQGIVDKLKEGNIFGCFVELLEEFRKKFAIGFVYHSGNVCPCCGKRLSVKLTYSYGKEEGVEEQDRVNITGICLKEDN